MKRRNCWKTISGILLAGAVLLGCFAPVMYGAYVIYDQQTHQVLTINIKAKPEDTYKNSIATIEERRVAKIVKRDDKEMLLTLERKNGLQATVKVSGLPKDASKLVITVEKGNDPKGEREEMVNTVLEVCSKAGVQCTEEKGKQ